MLFRPHEEKRLFGKRVPFTPGLIPKRRRILSEKTGQTVSTYLLTDETLIKYLCGDDFKHNAESVLDSFIKSARASKRTLGSIMLAGDNDTAHDEAALKMTAYFFGENIIELAAKLDECLFESNKEISALLPNGLSENVKLWISQNIDEVSRLLLELAESEFAEEIIKPLAISLIESNVKGFASLFVVPESIYRSFHEKAVLYLQNPDNYGATEKKLLTIYDKITGAEISEIAQKLAKASAIEDKRLFAALVENIKGSGSEASAEIKRSLTEGVAAYIVKPVLSMEIGTLLSGVEDAYFDTLKGTIMSKYDDAIRNSLPAVLEMLDFSKIIRDKIDEFEMRQAEEIIISVVDRELKAITYFGGLLGFIIGLVPPVLQSFGIQ